MQFALDPEIKDNLRTLFSWACDSSKADQYVGFDADQQPEILKIYPQLKEYFLGEQFPKDLLQLDAISDDSKTTPPWPIENKFKNALEHLLEWAGIYLNHSVGKDKLANFLDNFEKGFSLEGSEVAYLPTFGLSIDAKMERFEEFKLCEYLSLVYLTAAEHELLKQETRYPKDDQVKNILPVIALKIDIPLKKKTKEIVQNVNAAIEYFKVMVVGIFNGSVSTPIVLTGRKSPWHPLIVSGEIYREIPENKKHCTLRDGELKILRKYWPLLYPKSLKRYHVTANRLIHSDTRFSWQDKVVDISIAMESLIQGKTEILYRLSAVIPWLICEKSDDRPAVQKRIKEFYTLRSILVHGETIESDGELSKKFEKLSKEAFESELKTIKADIHQAMLILLLNEDLQTSQGQNHLILGTKANIVRHPLL